MVRQTHIQQGWRSSVSQRLFQACALGALLAASTATFAQSETEASLKEQMAEAQAELDEAAQRIAELSRQMAGGEVARVFKRVSVGERKAMLGVRIDNADEGEGVLIKSVTSDGPAERAGVEPGDVLRSFNGEDLTGMSSRDAIKSLMRALKQLEPADVARLDVLREGRNMTIDVTTESVSQSLPRFGHFTSDDGSTFELSQMLEKLSIELPEVHADIMINGDLTEFDLDLNEFEDLKQLPKRLEEAMGKLSGSGPVIAMLGGSAGLSHQFRFAPVTPGLGNYFGVDRGVLVTAVPDDKTLGLLEGDVLLSINGDAVESKHDVYAVFAQAEQGETLSVELVRQRESLTLDVAAPKNSWGKAWSCTNEKGEGKDFERCESKDGSAFSFRFSTDDE